MSVDMSDYKFSFMFKRVDGTEYPVYVHKDDPTRKLPLFVEGFDSWNDYLQDTMNNGGFKK